MLRPPPQVKAAVTEDDVLSYLPDVSSTCQVQMVLTLLSQPTVNFVRLRPPTETHLMAPPTFDSDVLVSHDS